MTFQVKLSASFSLSLISANRLFTFLDLFRILFPLLVVSQVRRKHIVDKSFLCMSRLHSIDHIPNTFFCISYSIHLALHSTFSHFASFFLTHNNNNNNTKQEQFSQSSKHFNGHNNCSRPCADFLTTNRPTIQIHHHQQNQHHHQLPMTRANWIQIHLNAQMRYVQRCWQFLKSVFLLITVNHFNILFLVFRRFVDFRFPFV